MTVPRTLSIALLAAGSVALAGLPAGAEERSGPAIPRFVEATKASKLKHIYGGDWQYFVGGGVATFDCNGDRVPELFLAGGSNPASLWLNHSSQDGGALRFGRLRSPVTDLRAVTGAYPLDIDSDGITDLALPRVGETVLLRGLGDCAFERANERWRFDGGTGWTTAFAATWEADGALPTLAFGSYVDTATSDERIGHCSANRLYRPDAAGTGYDAPILLTPGHCALSMLFSDWGRTGQVDLRVSNDRHYAPAGEEQLWRMTPGQPPTLYDATDGWQKLVIWGMGIASRDLTGDGRPEIYLTSQADNKLQRLVEGAPGPTYEDIALARGVNAPKPVHGGDPFPSTAWHPAFEDVNNDGLVDLYVAKGNVEAQEGYATKDPSQFLLQQPDGTFRDATKQAGLLHYERGRGAAVVDLNNDGLLDVVEVVRDKPVRVWRNVGSGTPKQPAAMGRWLALRLHQAGPNGDAIGSIIEVRVGEALQTLELTVGGGHAGDSLGWSHLGVPSEGEIEVRITWPGGDTGPWTPVEGNAWYLADRGAGTLTRTNVQGV